MKALKRLSLLVPLTAWLGVQSCVTDNPAAYQGIFGDNQPPSGAVVSTSSGGTQGGSSSETSSSGGQAGAGNAGEAGANASGEAGDRSTDTSTGGTDGSSTTGEVPSEYWPPCDLGLSQSGEEIKKGTPCTPDDPQLCYRQCGPYSVGWKTETCLAGVYAEGDCTFPQDGDYECFRIPDVIDPTGCGLDAPPKAVDECTAPACMACNFNGVYFDTGDNSKEGYCLCREPDENGVRVWTCASTTAWPCPFGRGC